MTVLLAIRAVLTVRALVLVSCSVSPTATRCDPGAPTPHVTVTGGVVHVDF